VRLKSGAFRTQTVAVQPNNRIVHKLGMGNGASGIGHRELGIGNWYLVTNDNS
jgi:hypothetical protein